MKKRRVVAEPFAANDDTAAPELAALKATAGLPSPLLPSPPPPPPPAPNQPTAILVAAASSRLRVDIIAHFALVK